MKRRPTPVLEKNEIVHGEASNKLNDLTECNYSNASQKETNVKATLTLRSAKY